MSGKAASVPMSLIVVSISFGLIYIVYIPFLLNLSKGNLRLNKPDILILLSPS